LPDAWVESLEAVRDTADEHALGGQEPVMCDDSVSVTAAAVVGS
jgi:hypothetical protein